MGLTLPERRTSRCVGGAPISQMFADEMAPMGMGPTLRRRDLFLLLAEQRAAATT